MTEPMTTEHNPFMLLLHPEAVLAAVEKSERLGRLNRHLCRPLDRPTPTSVRAADGSGGDSTEGEAAADVADTAQPGDQAEDGGPITHS